MDKKDFDEAIDLVKSTMKQKHYLIAELLKMGIKCETEESIYFITKKIHNEPSMSTGLHGAEINFAKKLVSDEDVLVYYAVNGNSGGCILSKTEDYDPLTLMWFLGKKGLSKDMAKAFLQQINNELHPDTLLNRVVSGQADIVIGNCATSSPLIVIHDEYNYYAENDEHEDSVNAFDGKDNPHPVFDIHITDVTDGNFKYIPRCVDWSKGLLDYLITTVGKSPEISIGCYVHGQATFIAFDIQGEKVGVSYTIGLTKNYIELPNDVSHAGEFFVPGTVDAFEIIENIVTNTSAVMKIKRF